MARLKFIRFFESGQEQIDVVECDHYSVTSYSNGWHEVTVYPGYTNQEGISYRVSNAHPDAYPACFVEASQTGKTIDRIRATDSIPLDGAA